MNFYYKFEVGKFSNAKHQSEILLNMKNTNILILFFTLLGLLNTTQAQDTNWRYYRANGYIFSMEEQNSNLWIGTSSGLVKHNLASNSHTIYNTKNSKLPHNFVQSIAIDSKGSKWIGTRTGGLAKFDDTSWTDFNDIHPNLSNTSIYSISIDSNETKWLASSIGVIKFEDSCYSVYNLYNGGPYEINIRSIYIDEDGNKWVGTISSLYKYNDSTWDLKLLKGINTITSDNNDALWFGTYRDVMKYKDGSWTTYSYDTNYYSCQVYSITPDSDGNIWIESNIGLHILIDSIWIPYKTIYPDFPNNLNSLAKISNNGIKWFVTNDQRVLKYHNSVWTEISISSSGLYSNDIRSLAIDNNEVLWAGSYKGGLSKFDNTKWISYNTDNSGITDNDIWAITVDGSNNKWLATLGRFSNHGHGLVKYDEEHWTSYHVNNSDIPNNDLFSVLADSSGNIWMGTYGGLSRFDGKNWTNYTILSFVHSMAIDNNGVIWFGTVLGLASYDGTSWEIYRESNSGLSHNDIESIAIDSDNNIWIGTYGEGLVIFDGTNWTHYHEYNSILPDNYVLSIAIEPNDTKWIGTYGGGMVKIEDTNWTLYNSDNSGLMCNIVQAIVVDKNGSKWIGTGTQGVNVYNEIGFPNPSHAFDATTKTKIEIYPNPSNNYFNIEIYSNNSPYLMELIGLNGEVLKRKLITNNHNIIALDNLKTGLYIVKLSCGEEIHYKKIIKTEIGR